jgi:hypothetical protein
VLLLPVLPVLPVVPLLLPRVLVVLPSLRCFELESVDCGSLLLLLELPFVCANALAVSNAIAAALQRTILCIPSLRGGSLWICRQRIESLSGSRESFVGAQKNLLHR